MLDVRLVAPGIGYKDVACPAWQVVCKDPDCPGKPFRRYVTSSSRAALRVASDHCHTDEDWQKTTQIVDRLAAEVAFDLVAGGSLSLEDVAGMLPDVGGVPPADSGRRGDDGKAS